MTAPIPPNADDRNDLVSAYIDGVAAPDEVAMVEASPELMAQVASMRSVTTMLGSEVSPPVAVREAHLAAALSEFDSLFGADDQPVAATAPLAAVPDPTPAPAEPAAVETNVLSLADARTTRSARRPRRLNMIAAAAAAVALLFAGVVAVGLNSGGEARDTVSEASDAVSDAAIGSSSANVLAADDAADAMDDSAMDDDEAMADEEMGAVAMETTSRAEAAPTPPAPQAEAAMEEAADAEADFASDAMDDDEAMADDAMEDSAASGVAPDVGFLGGFDDVDTLQTAMVESLADSDMVTKALNLVPTVSPTECPDTIGDLTGLPGATTLLGTARLQGEAVELHRSVADEVLVIGIDGCTVVATLGSP